MTVTELTPEMFEALLPTLTAKDQRIILLDETAPNEPYFSKLGISPAEFKKRHGMIERHLAKVCDACDRLDVSVESISQDLLDAPIELLNLDHTTENLLKRKPLRIKRISELYRNKITNNVLIRVPSLAKKRISSISLALNRIGLPKLRNARPDSLIYRFYDPEYASNLLNQEAMLLKDKYWSMMSDDEISKKHNVSEDKILDIAEKAEDKLLQK